MKLKFLLIGSIVLSIPVALLEYFVLFWFWSGDGTFTLVATPIAFITYFVIQICLMKKISNYTTIQTVLKFTMILLTPLLSMLTVWLIAKACGGVIIIQ